MSFTNNKQGVLILFTVGLILVVLWLIGKFIATSWLPDFYVDMFGAIGFLIVGFIGLTQANEKVAPKKDEEE